MRVTEKGQVTIPKPIRDKLGIGPGSEVSFVEDGENVRLVRSVQSDEARMAEMMDHFSRMRGTVDYHGMDGKTFVDWLRGPRDDYDPH